MKAPQSLIDQLEDAIAHKNIGHRADALRRVTDLFASGSGLFTEDQVALFDDVMGRLVAQIDVSVRAAFGQRLAALADAPLRVLRELALDDAIEVAGPVLALAERLDETTLVESARTKSQDHLLAIARRKILGEPVTDVLVDRGNRAVVHTAAENSGAKFSELGYSKLVQKARDDAALAFTVWMRPEIPRQHLLAIFAQASEALRLTLQAADPARAALLRDMVAQASDEIQAATRARYPAHMAAQARVVSLQQASRLDAAQLSEFARAGSFEEVAIALSLMADLPIGLIERAMTHERIEQALVLAKAIGLDWETTRDILALQAGVERAAKLDPETWRESFARLQPDMAKKAISFYRLRERARRTS